MMYRGYHLRDDGVSIKIETLSGTVISEGSDMDRAQLIIDGWQNAK